MTKKKEKNKIYLVIFIKLVRLYYFQINFIKLSKIIFMNS